MIKIKELFETYDDDVAIDLSERDLTTLASLNVPNNVKQNFDCGYNRLTTLEGAPRKVGMSFLCNNNKLKTLEGGPNKIHGSLNFKKNHLTSLQNIHLLFKGGFIKGFIDFSNNPIKSHILGLMLIPELQGIIFREEEGKDLRQACRIINMHLKADRDVWKCQEELMDNDLHEFAQL